MNRLLLLILIPICGHYSFPLNASVYPTHKHYEKMEKLQLNGSNLFCPTCKKGSIDVSHTLIFLSDFIFKGDGPVKVTCCSNCKESFTITTGSRKSLAIIENKSKKPYLIECPKCKKSYLKRLYSRMGPVPFLCTRSACNPKFFRDIIPYSGGASVDKTLTPEKDALPCNHKDCSGRLLTEFFPLKKEDDNFINFKLTICQYHPH